MSGQVPYVSQSVGMTAADAQQVGTDQTVVASTTSLTDINNVVRVAASLTGASITGNISSSGNISVGTPQTWDSGYNVVQNGVWGATAGDNTYIGSMSVTANLRATGNETFSTLSGTGESYYGARYRMDGAGNHRWYTSATAGAGGAVTMNNLMTLTQSSRLLVGTTTDDGVNALQVNGSVQASGTVTSSILAATKSGPALLYVTDTTSPASQLLISSASGVNTRIGTTTTHNIDFFINSATKMTLSSTGLAVTGNISSSGTITPQQATTAGAPAYVKGAIYFDTTLNKLRVGGATAWETITSV